MSNEDRKPPGPEIEGALRESWDRNKDAYRYLSGASMSTDTIEETQAATEDFTIPAHMQCNSCDFTKPNGDPSPCPEGHLSGFTRADMESPLPEADLYLVGASDTEGELGDEPEQPEPDHLVDTNKMVESEPEDPETVAMKLALGNLYSIQDRLSDAVEDHAEKAEMAKTAKKRVESLQEDLNEAVTKLRHAKDASEPDPAKFPLFDKAKADINAEFPAPVAIQPLPPDTFAEALRRKQRDTPLAAMGFKPATLKVLTEKHGLKTALDLVNKVTEYGQRNMEFTRAEGITELRFEEVAEKLDELTGECESAWKADHPDEEIPLSGDDE